ncbi:hypothetical protein [Sulfitobacter sp.]|uniref:hypothetical protein n=1 Tax=Sulfitobacter sp. TaxID=1903071 RepID=UPI0040591A0B
MTNTETRLWIALILSIGSLIWNEVNRRKTNAMARRLRQESIRLEEFRSAVKDPLRQSLTGCEVVAQRAEALATSGKSLSDLREDLSTLNTESIAALSDLENRLSDANQSIFADGADWLAEFEIKQDTIYQKLDLAVNENRPESDRRRALIEIKSEFISLRAGTNTRIDTEIASLAAD